MCLVPPALFYTLSGAGANAVPWVQSINILVPRVLPIPLPDLATTPISSKLIHLTCLWALCPLFLTGAHVYTRQRHRINIKLMTCARVNHGGQGPGVHRLFPRPITIIRRCVDGRACAGIYT